jgi:hypothetical protein
MGWRGIGAFLLFVALYMVTSPAAGVIAIYAVDNPVVHKVIDLFSGNKQTIVSVIAAGLGSLVSMSLAIIAHTAIMEERPARGIGVAFILWQVAYAFNFLTLLSDEVELTNPIFVEACVTCVAAWVLFRLPPFKRQPALEPDMLWWARVVGSAGIAIVAITVFVIIAVDR